MLSTSGAEHSVPTPEHRSCAHARTRCRASYNACAGLILPYRPFRNYLAQAGCAALTWCCPPRRLPGAPPRTPHPCLHTQPSRLANCAGFKLDVGTHVCNRYGAPNRAVPPVARRGFAPRALNGAGRSRHEKRCSSTTAHSPRTRCRALYNACVGSTELR